MGFKYVFIPASPNEEIQELEYAEDIVDLEKDTFRQFVTDYFSKLGGSIDREVLLAQLKAKTGFDLKDKDGPNMDQLLNATTVEIFPVQLPTKQVNFEGISVYCDDKGVAKELEQNDRMSGLVQACGYPGQVFRGDCFIGRVFDDNEDVWKRSDFTLKDMSADAPWVISTKQQRSKRSVNDVSTMSNMMGMQNPARVNPDTMAEADAKGETEQYCWRQADDEVEVTFKKDGLQKGDKKAVKVTYTSKRLKVEAKGETLIDAELFESHQPDEATWTLADGVLQVTMTKVEPTPWSRLLKDE